MPVPDGAERRRVDPLRRRRQNDSQVRREDTMSFDKAAVRKVLDEVKADGRTALTAPEAKRVCDAYAIPLPQEGLATTADQAVSLASGMGYPVVMKIVSADILHKTDAGGVIVGVKSDQEARSAY